MKKALAGVLGLGAVGVLGVSAWSAAAMTRPDVNPAPHPAQIAVADTISTRRDHVKVLLKDVKGQRVAQVDIDAVRQGGNRVTTGFHAIHIHAVGVCDPAGAKPFASAGGHFNPTGAAEGMQAGAFPVLLAGANGEAQAQFLDGNFTIRDLFGVKGAAIVIHAGADNYANIPTRYAVNGVAGPDAETQMTGDAGARFACGVVSAPRIKSSASPSTSMSGM
jgi:Cu-Zn family superoxide dismutase